MSELSFDVLRERALRDPRFWPVREAFVDVCTDEREVPSPERIDEVLGPRARIRFVRAEPRPRRRGRRGGDPGIPYDTRIVRDGEVPTRPGCVHDLMNALVWAAFPEAKRALHARQRALVTPAARFESQRRPRELDTLALVDEGGVLVPSGGGAAAVFGHALYQGIALGWPDPWASAVRLAVSNELVRPGARVAALDASLASLLAGGGLTDPAELGRYDLGVFRGPFPASKRA